MSDLSEEADVPYRTPIEIHTAQQTSSTDENNFDTLESVRAILDNTVTSLYKDFNAFELAKNKMPLERAKILLYEVQVKQGVYDIVQPMLDQITDTIDLINGRHRSR